MAMDALSRATLERGCFQIVCTPSPHILYACHTAQPNRSLCSHKPTMLETYTVDHSLGGQERVGVVVVGDIVVATSCHRRLVLSGRKRNNRKRYESEHKHKIQVCGSASSLSDECTRAKVHIRPRVVSAADKLLTAAATWCVLDSIIYLVFTSDSWYRMFFQYVCDVLGSLTLPCNTCPAR